MDLNPSASEKLLNECQPKKNPNLRIKVNTMRHILSFSAEPILRLTCQKHFGNHPKRLL